MGEKRRVGILGGTFDPIHEAHLQMGREAREAFSLDQVWFMPTGVSYFKSGERRISSPGDRAAMVRLAIEGEPGFIFSDIEIRRGGATYTSETLQELCRRYPDTEFYFILGADSIRDIARWHLPEVIFACAVIIAANRDDQVPEEELTREIGRLEERYGARIRPMSFQSPVSSSEIRSGLASGESAAESAVPPAVLAYIQEHRLYREPEKGAAPYDDGGNM